MKIENATSSNYADLVNDGLVLVDFFATWCGPCKMLGPVLEELSSDRAEIKIIKVDIDESEDLARQFGVMSVPTLLLYKDGQIVSQKTGYMPKELLNNWIEENK